MTPWIHAIGTRSALAALCGALFLGAGSIALRRWRPAAIVAGGATLEQLRIDAMTLRSNDDASAAAAVERRRQLEAELWTEAALSKWKTSLPPRWRLQEAQSEQGATTWRRRFVLTLRDAAARDWPEIVNVLKSLDELPATTAEGLTLTSSHSRPHEFETVQVILALAFTKVGSPAAAKHDE